jgi:hypothetical protein
MEQSEFQLYLHCEITSIEIDRSIDIIMCGVSSSEEFVLAWVEEKAESYRKKWDSSLCRECAQCRFCGHLVLSACPVYENKPKN